MKRNKIFIVAGTLALAIAGFLNANANSKKFVAAVTAYFYTAGTGGAIYTLFKGVSSAGVAYNWTLTNTSKTAIFKTGGTILSKVFAVKAGSPATLNTTVFIK